MAKVFLDGREVVVVELVDANTERIAVRDIENHTINNIPATKLTGETQEEVVEELSRIQMVHTCLANLLSRLRPTDGLPGGELERIRKKILNN